MGFQLIIETIGVGIAAVSLVYEIIKDRKSNNSQTDSTKENMEIKVGEQTLKD